MPSLEVIEVVNRPPKTATDSTVDMDSNPSKEMQKLSTAGASPAAMEVDSTSNDGCHSVQSSALGNSSGASSQNNEHEEPQEEPTDNARVTPNDTPNGKKKQQKKVNQLTLNTFFRPFAGSKPSPQQKAAKSPPRCAFNDDDEDKVAIPVPNKPQSDTRNPTKKEKDETEPEHSGAVVNASPTTESRNAAPEVNCKTTGSVTQDGNTSMPGSPTTDREAKERLTSKPIILAEKFHASCDEKREPEKTASASVLSPERKELLRKYQLMMQQCKQRSCYLKKAATEGIEEEDFEMPSLQSSSSLPDEEFPDTVVNNMAILIEGSSLPLSELSAEVAKKLKECHGRVWADEAIRNKIKLVAERKAFLESAAAVKNDALIKYEDAVADRVWRWEIGIIDVLPSNILSKVKKARTARKKLLNHFNANRKLFKSLENASEKLQDQDFDKVDMVLSKILKDEEKVLKFEREAEKQRMAQLAHKKRLQEQKEKERKKSEAEQKKLEKEREKQEVIEARETEKQKKLEERRLAEEAKKEKQIKKEQSLNKQKAFLISFLKKPNEAKSASPKKSTACSNSGATSYGFDAETFRSQIDSRTTLNVPLFATFTKSARASRKRRTRKVPVSVTVIPEASGFDELPFAEQKVIHVPNKYKFLSFQEDLRPPYHGTWSKRSKIVTGKTPFARDPEFLKYDYDSEASWEEGDDDIGEDIDDDAQNMDEDEEDNAAKYDFEDGFCIADDQYLDTDEGVDEEAKALYRKKLQKENATIEANRICIVSPAEGGIPANHASFEGLVEGFDKEEAEDLCKIHEGKQILHDPIWLDPFTPDNIDDIDPMPEPEKNHTQNSNKDEYSIDDMKKLASFAHHNSLNSKDKLIEELRVAHPSVFDNRAKATRKLDSIAEKKKHPNGTGVYWEVNKDVLEELELKDVLARQLTVCDEAEPKKVPSNKRKISDTVESSETKVHVPLQRKKVKVAPTQKSEQVSPWGGQSPQKEAKPHAADNTPTIMNFLQPRKKPKKA